MKDGDGDTESRRYVPIQFQNTLHSFCTVRRMGNTSFEEKLLQNLTATMMEVLYEILLDLHKAYDILYHSLFLNTLVA